MIPEPQKPGLRTLSPELQAPSRKSFTTKPEALNLDPSPFTHMQFIPPANNRNMHLTYSTGLQHLMHSIQVQHLPYSTGVQHLTHQHLCST